MINHEAIDAIVTSQGGYGKGVTPNPFAEIEPIWSHWAQNAAARDALTAKIRSLMEPRFITAPHTCEFIEALITMTGALRVLELGCHTGFCSLHMLRALVGRVGAAVVSVDARPAHDWEFFHRFEEFRFVEGWSPAILNDPGITGHAPYDIIFVDSDHRAEETAAEFNAIKPLTHPGTIILFHDVPAWQTPDNPKPHPVRAWLDGMISNGTVRGLVLPTTTQLDCQETFGPNYPPQLNPHLGMVVMS